MSFKTPKPIGHAVSALLWYQDQILMVKRSLGLKVFPGYWAFPGGKLNPGETEPQALSREVEEEVGLQIKGEDFFPHGSVTTPPTHPYRFKTSYFSRELTLQEFNFALESTNSEFCQIEAATAAQFLERYDVGNRLMVPPVRFFLAEIANKGMQHAKVMELDLDALDKINYALEVQSDVYQLFVKSPTLFPQIYTNCVFIKDKNEGILIDPSPMDLPEWKKMIRSLESLNFKPTKIICTHHHPDHCAMLDHTAAHFGVSIYAHATTWAQGTKKNPEFWEKLIPYKKIIKEGDVIGKWKGQDLICYEVPGHDAGQVALAPNDLNFFLASDLFQSEGSVVIGGPGSSMKTYMDTLKRVIALNPQVLYPSHGIALGGVNALKRVTQHRLRRHHQIYQLQQEKKKPEEMVDLLYPDLPDFMRKYAVYNVKSHLEWLAIESFEVAKNTFSENDK